jgi:CheY-like chemotaxis protein
MTHGFAGCTVLVIDDSAQDVALIAAAFADLGTPPRIVSVEDADQAEAYLLGTGAYADRRSCPLPDLILLDIQIPVRDGLEILQWIRSRDASWRQVPIVMLTTSHDYAEIRRAYDLGANSFMVKPTGFAELRDLVRDVAHYWLVRNSPCGAARRDPDPHSASADAP